MNQKEHIYKLLKRDINWFQTASFKTRKFIVMSNHGLKIHHPFQSVIGGGEQK